MTKTNLSILEDSALALLFFSVLLVFSTQVQVHFTLPKLVALRICSVFVIGLWIYRISVYSINAIPRAILFSSIALGVWWIISSFFAVHIPTALHGVYGRYNALLNHLLYLILFFVVASTPRTGNRIIKLFIAALIPVAVYAIFQHFKIDIFPWPQGDRSASTIGNPVILGAVLALGFPLALSLKKWWLIAAAILLVGIITTISRGAYVAVAVSVIILILTKSFKKYFILLLILSVSLSCSARLTERAGITVRGIYYKAAFEGIKSSPIFGVGFENFRIIYPKYRQPEDSIYHKNVIPTMVHNGYIQLAMTNGIPALILYLALVGMILFSLIKRKNYFFVAAIAGYMVQDLTGWLEIALTPFFWIILGLCSPTNGDQIKGYSLTKVIAWLCLAFTAFLSFDSINRLHADNIFYKAQVVKNYNLLDINIKEGLEFVSDDFYYYDLVGTLYLKQFAKTGDVDTYKKSVVMLDRAHTLNPFDIYVLIHRLDIETMALKQGIISKPLELADKIIAMDKNNPTVYESAMKLRIIEKRYPEALEYLKKAMILIPNDENYIIWGKQLTAIILASKK
jgi:putative inorganic carbon (HCO3(-)) transporter